MNFNAVYMFRIYILKFVAHFQFDSVTYYLIMMFEIAYIAHGEMTSLSVLKLTDILIVFTTIALPNK